MRLNIRITYTNGDVKDVKITPKAEVAFEDWAGVGIHIALSSEHGKNKNVYRLAWEACKAAGIVVAPFDDWLTDIEDADIAAPKAVEALTSEAAN